MEAGIEVAGKEIKKGCRIIAIGEMGIEHFAASAILSVLRVIKLLLTGVGTG